MTDEQLVAECYFPRLQLDEVGEDMPIAVHFARLYSPVGEKMLQNMLIYENRGMSVTLSVTQPPKGGWPVSVVEKYKNGV